MITVDTPDTRGNEANDKAEMDYTILVGDNKVISFANEWLDICSDQYRKIGAMSYKTSKKKGEAKSGKHILSVSRFW